MTGAFVYLYQLIAFMVFVAIVTTVIAIGLSVFLCAVAGAVLMGLLMPSRTVKGQLQTLDRTITEGFSIIKGLDPR
jgi:hypothetical protein